ncbi:lateral signaling target protein 2 homolog [Anopheles marshallii]|uniref:lateral signaling target protein 2 homolog n=1 Tax=Anopheles marshallii TaxID=1521116 RepID=UPI00237BCACB|nr:lateral signaling target protein 2 homolog [Anopheles marshallii]
MDKFVRNVNTMDETILVPCRLMDCKVGDATDTVPAAPKAQHHGAHHGKKSNRASIRETLNTSELFALYNMLKVVKVDLLWGRQDAEDSVEESVVMGCATKSSTSSKGNSNNTDTTGTNNSTANSTNSSNNTATDVTTSTNSSTGTSVSVTGSEKVVDANNSPAPMTATSAKGHNRRPSTVSVASSNSASTLSDSDSETSAENDSGIESEGNQEQDRSAELAKQFRTHLIGLYRSLEQMSEAANYLTARYQSDVGPV